MTSERPDAYEEFLEERFGTADDDRGLDEYDTADEWAVEQQGLGDRKAEGQVRLDGGIAKEGGSDE